jgi:Cu(I)/Ag(I) efflux system membrane fusion protein
MTRAFLLTIALLALVIGCGTTPETPPAHDHAGATAAAQPIYQCPMHPQIIRHEPGTCPICGMTLQRVDEAAPVPEPPVAGHAAFTLSAARQQLIGVTHAPAVRRALARDIRAAGTIANDPALYQALIEYREALRTRRALGGSTVHEAHEGAAAVVQATVLRLHRLGLGERELDALARAGVDPTTLILPGPHVWVYAQLYEEEAALVAPGQPMTVTTPALPGRDWNATVLAIDPVVSPTTRTVRVRALVDTPGGELRPDAYVTATLHVPLGDRLAVPREAVLDSGTRRIVFVTTPDGTFTPHEVTLGPLAQGYYAVQDGLAEGDEVVTSANFLIDSESRFRAAVSAFGGGAAPAHHH